jgi:hypothetical protein
MSVKLVPPVTFGTHIALSAECMVFPMRKDDAGTTRYSDQHFTPVSRQAISCQRAKRHDRHPQKHEQKDRDLLVLSVSERNGQSAHRRDGKREHPVCALLRWQKVSIDR